MKTATSKLNHFQAFDQQQCSLQLNQFINPELKIANNPNTKLVCTNFSSL